jgi:hypothetical protein
MIYTKNHMHELTRSVAKRNGFNASNNDGLAN